MTGETAGMHRLPCGNLLLSLRAVTFVAVQNQPALHFLLINKKTLSWLAQVCVVPLCDSLLLILLLLTDKV